MNAYWEVEYAAHHANMQAEIIWTEISKDCRKEDGLKERPLICALRFFTCLSVLLSLGSFYTSA